MGIRYTLTLPLILLLLQACVWGTGTKLSDRVGSPTGYQREARTEFKKPFVRDNLKEFLRFERNRVNNYCSLTVYNKQKPEEDGLYIDLHCDSTVDVYVGRQSGQPDLRDETFENHDTVYNSKLKVLGE